MRTLRLHSILALFGSERHLVSLVPRERTRGLERARVSSRARSEKRGERSVEYSSGRESILCVCPVLVRVCLWGSEFLLILEGVGPESWVIFPENGEEDSLLSAVSHIWHRGAKSWLAGGKNVDIDVDIHTIRVPIGARDPIGQFLSPSE
jgi:hypothetical protein